MDYSKPGVRCDNWSIPVTSSDHWSPSVVQDESGVKSTAPGEPLETFTLPGKRNLTRRVNTPPDEEIVVLVLVPVPWVVPVRRGLPIRGRGRLLRRRLPGGRGRRGDPPVNKEDSEEVREPL